jgi:hypothetical protein
MNETKSLHIGAILAGKSHVVAKYFDITVTNDDDLLAITHYALSDLLLHVRCIAGQPDIDSSLQAICSPMIQFKSMQQQ